MSVNTVILAQTDHHQADLMMAVFKLMGLSVENISRDQPFKKQLYEIAKLRHDKVMICVDLARLAEDSMVWPDFTKVARNCFSYCGLIATQCRLLQPNPHLITWTKMHGAYAFSGRVSTVRMKNSFSPILQSMREHFGISIDLDHSKDSISQSIQTANQCIDAYDLYQRTWRRLESIGLTLENLIIAMKDSDDVSCQDRRYRLRNYADCFVGSDATLWLAKYLSCSIEQAVDVGNLLVKSGYIYHVVKQQPFRNGHFYYRYSLPTRALAMIEIDRVIKESRELIGFDIKDRLWRGITFARSFVGLEAAKWLSSFYGIGQNDSIMLGQNLLDIYQFRHVTDQHDFIDQKLFYRMTVDSVTA